MILGNVTESGSISPRKKNEKTVSKILPFTKKTDKNHKILKNIKINLRAVLTVLGKPKEDLEKSQRIPKNLEESPFLRPKKGLTCEL